MSMSPTIRPLDLSPTGLITAAEMLREVFPGSDHLTRPYLQWIYRDNPDGMAIGREAWIGETLIGHCAAMPMRALVNGVEHRGAGLINGAVLRAHARGGVMHKVAFPIFDELRDLGYSFALAFGGVQSTPWLAKYFTLIGALEVRIGWAVPDPPLPGAAASFVRTWSTEALHWRFQNPSREYRREKYPQGGIVLTPAGRLLDAIVDDGLHLDHIHLPAPTRRRPRLWIGFDGRRRWRGFDYSKVPRRLRGPETNLFFMDLTGKLRPEPEHFVFRPSDFDAY